MSLKIWLYLLGAIVLAVFWKYALAALFLASQLWVLWHVAKLFLVSSVNAAGWAVPEVWEGNLNRAWDHNTERFLKYNFRGLPTIKNKPKDQP